MKNDNKNINFIDGANHGYTGKEEILAESSFSPYSKNNPTCLFHHSDIYSDFFSSEIVLSISIGL